MMRCQVDGIPRGREMGTVARRLGVTIPGGICLCVRAVPEGCRLAGLFGVPQVALSFPVRGVSARVFSNRSVYLPIFPPRGPLPGVFRSIPTRVPGVSCVTPAWNSLRATPRERYGSRSITAAPVDVATATCDLRPHKAAHIFCTRTRRHCCGSAGQGGPVDSLGLGSGETALPAPVASGVQQAKGGSRASYRRS